MDQKYFWKTLEDDLYTHRAGNRLILFQQEESVILSCAGKQTSFSGMAI